MRIRRERDSESNTLYLETRERQTFVGQLDHLRENQRKVKRKKREKETLRTRGTEEVRSVTCEEEKIF